MKKLSTTLILLCSLGLASAVNAKTCELEINSDDKMKFDQTELSVAGDCTEVKLTLNHTGILAQNVMGHNWVLSKTADFQAIGTAGMSAGLDNNYIPEDKSKVLAYTEVIGGGASTSITFSTDQLTAGGDYTFFCSFPGHWAIMKGKFNFG